MEGREGKKKKNKLRRKTDRQCKHPKVSENTHARSKTAHACFSSLGRTRKQLISNSSPGSWETSCTSGYVQFIK